MCVVSENEVMLCPECGYVNWSCARYCHSCGGEVKPGCERCFESDCEELERLIDEAEEEMNYELAGYYQDELSDLEENFNVIRIRRKRGTEAETKK